MRTIIESTGQFGERERQKYSKNRNYCFFFFVQPILSFLSLSLSHLSRQTNNSFRYFCVFFYFVAKDYWKIGFMFEKTKKNEGWNEKELGSEERGRGRKRGREGGNQCERSSEEFEFQSERKSKKKNWIRTKNFFIFFFF